MANLLKTGLALFGHGSHVVVDPMPGLYAFWLRGTCLYVGMSENLARRVSEHETAEANPALNRYFCKFPGEIKMSIVYVNADANRLRDLESESIVKLRPLTNTNREGGPRHD